MNENSEGSSSEAFDTKDMLQELSNVAKGQRNECSDDEYADAQGGSESTEELSDDLEEELKEKYRGFSDEDLEKLKNEADSLKNDANVNFKDLKFEEALKLYSDALNICPLKFAKNRAVLYSNRAAAKMSLNKNKEAVGDCTKAIALDPDYLRAILRRAQLHQKLDELDESYEDFKKVLELDKNNMEARLACANLPAQIEEKNEKMKTEMFGKLKELGNVCLKPFGLSTDNFKVVQDPSSGGYSISFQNNQ